MHHPFPAHPPRAPQAAAVVFGVLLLAAASPLRAGPPAGAAFWPQWRGPLANGVAPQADPPTQWSDTQNLQWKVRLPGRGTSTPVVWGDRIFVSTAIPVGSQSAAAPAGGASAGGRPTLSIPPKGAQQFALLCLDRATGKTLWQRVVREELPHEGHHPDGTFASASPVTDGKIVTAFFGSRGLYAFDLEGNPKWQKDFGKMKVKMSFGEGCSPALDSDILVVNWDHEGEDFIAAFDPATGNQRWHTPRDESTSWATPLIVRAPGPPQVITAATGKIRGYDLSTGKLLWECGGLTANVIPSPVTSDGILYAMSGFRGAALLAIRLGRTGDLSATDAIAWKHGKNTPYVPSPLLYNGRLYFCAGNNAVLSCFDAKTGRPHYDAQRVEGLEGVYASPIGAAGRVYLAGRNGATVVLKDADTYEVLATNRLTDRFDASPVAVGKQLLLRGREFLYCFSQ